MHDPVDLPDLNVWLALSVADHVHHARARQYWADEAGQQLAFCRVTALGLVRLLTHSTVMGDAPLAMAEAWSAYLAFRRLPEIVLAAEPLDVERWLAEWSTSKRSIPRLWTDAYLAAFARAGGFRLVTFDSDFVRFDDLECLRLGT
jgi:toxin-antitoxin system PIN domain toxin